AREVPPPELVRDVIFRLREKAEEIQFALEIRSGNDGLQVTIYRPVKGFNNLSDWFENAQAYS
ncbi:MAG: hypothetical protein JWN49_634, partial [Parcubacteria group bacterium]|nr:hypothetical protein [Parcubacteria group bacterium]